MSMRSRTTLSLLSAFLVLAGLALIHDAVSAQEAGAGGGTTVPVNLDIHAQVRHRFELDGRAKFDEDASATEYSLLRSRLSVMAHLPKKVHVFLQGQDARVWGEEASTVEGSSPRGDMHQGYILAEDLFSPGVWVKLGRTEISFANERLLGVSDWSNTGRAFDGVLLGYKAASYEIQLFETKIAEGVGDAARGKDRDFFGALASLKAAGAHSINLFAMMDHDKDTLSTGEDLVKRLSLGGHAKGAVAQVQYEGDVALQTGDQGGRDISASLFGGRVGYAIVHPYEPTFWVGLDYLSGDEDAADDEVGVFNTQFGTNHRYYGMMDLFTDIPRDTRGAGLVDFLLKASIKPTSWLTTSATFHSFQAAEDLVVENDDGSQETLSSFGSELDLLASVTCTDEVGVQAGFGFFPPGEIFERFNGDGTAYWGYLQTTVSY